MTKSTTCGYPDCTEQKTGERFCKKHLAQARRWLKEEYALDQVSEPPDTFVTRHPAYPGGPTYPWADWDWDDPLHHRPEGLDDEGWDWLHD